VSKRIKNIWSILSVAVILSAIVAVGSIKAATVSSVTHFPTSLQTSTAANHTLSFTTPTGVSEGSTITVSFDTNFDTSTITEDDVDITDDSTDLSTASDCSATDEASVSIAADILTITICAGDGGAIAAASAIVIDIGSNATSSGTGSNQITNPSGAATYFVSVAGTFGDVGSIALPISAASSSVLVSVAIPSQAGGAPAGPPAAIPPVLDTQAPVISNIVVSSITTTSAKVSWTTDEAASSNVDYGKTEDVNEGIETSAALVTSHSLSLTGLTEGVPYYFQIRSADVDSNQGSSPIVTFSTLDETKPVILTKNVTDILGESVKVVFTTDEKTKATVEYGLTNAYGSSSSSAEALKAHSVALTSLTSSTLYHYRILVSDLSSNQTVSEDLTFTTSADLPPSNISNFTVAPGNAKNVLSWSNPADADLTGVKIIVCLNESPSSSTDPDCSQIYSAKGETYTHSGLSNGTTYYYGAFSFDAAGQFASGALGSGKPSAPEEEVPLKQEKDTPKQTPPVTGDKKTGTGQTGDDSSGQTGSTSDKSTSSGSAETCGNNICSESETVFSCPKDCLAKQPPSLGTEVGKINLSDILFIVGRGSIKLQTESGFIDMLGGTELSVQVPAEVLGSGVKSASITLGSEKFLLRPVEASEKLSRAYGFNARQVQASKDKNILYYVADIITPQAERLHSFTLFVNYEDVNQTVSSFLNVLAPGYTFEDIDGKEALIGGVKLTLQENSGNKAVTWDGSPFAQFNPVTSGNNGAFAWYVLNGQYSVRAEHAKFETTNSGGFTVSNNIANPRIQMASIKTIEKPIIEGNVLEKTSASISTTVKAIVDAPILMTIQGGLDVVRDVPGVQEAAVASIPTLAVTAGASVVLMAVAFDFLPFLQYFFTAPILFFWRRKRKGFGTVYNAVSKEPVDLAVVRLFQLFEDTSAPGKMVKSRVTDKGGRFFFLVQPGKYKITVTKSGFQFPTEYMKDETEDGQFLDVYHSEVIEVTENDAVITPNIPLDPSKADKFTKPSSIRWRSKLRLIQHVVALTGVIASIVFVIIRPSVLGASMVLVQIGVFLIARRIAKPRKPKSWGIVTDKATGRPLSNVVARIFEPKYNKLLETQVTDSKGRYTFLLGPNQYFAVFEKDGYTSTQINPIDYSKENESQDFSDDIDLNPKESKGAKSQVAPK
jgi:hypothetical protein